MSASFLKRISPIDLCGVAVCVSLIGVFIVAIVLPLSARRDAEQKRRLELAAARARAGMVAMDVRMARSDLQTLRKAVSETPLVLETADHLNARVADLAAFAKKCGLELQDIAPGNVNAGAQRDTVTIHLTAHGDFHSCMQFMNRLHPTMLDTSIKDFRMTQSDQTERSLLLDVNVLWFAKGSGLAAVDMKQ